MTPSTDYAAFRVDAEARLDGWNAAVEALLGWPQADFAGTPLTALYPPEYAAAGARELAEARAHGAFSLQCVQIRRDGTPFAADVLVTALYDGTGRFLGYQRTVRDVSPRRRTEPPAEPRAAHAAAGAAAVVEPVVDSLAARADERRLEDRTRTLLESITDAFYVLDADWRFSFVNQRALDQLEVRREDILGRVVWEVFPRLRHGAVRLHYEQAVRERVAVDFEVTWPGTPRWMEVHAYPSSEGLSVYFRDITARKRAEARDRFLLHLDDAIRALSHPDQISATAARLLGEHLGVGRCAYLDVDGDQETLHVVGDFCLDMPSMAGRHPLAAFGTECARVLRAGEPFVVEDTVDDPRVASVREVYDQLRIRSVAAVTLHRGRWLAGGVMVHQDTPRGWRTDEVELLRAVAGRCWESIERARVTRGLMRRTRALNLLAETGTRLLSEEQPHALIETLFGHVASILDLELCFNFLLADDGARLRLAVWHGIDDRAQAAFEGHELEDGVSIEAIARQRPVVCTAVQTREDDICAGMRSLGVRAYAAFPLLSGHSVIGTLSFGTTRRDAFEPDELEFLRAVSDQMAAAYARAGAAVALRESEERLSQAVAIAEMGTFETDLRTDVLLVNGPGRSIYGWLPDETITFRRVQTHFHPEERERVLHIIADALAPSASGAFDIEQRIVRSDGTERWIRVRARAVFDLSREPRRPVRVLGTFLDITERKEAEERRERLLENERQARAEAERVGRMKDEFLATLSHELRTPLNAILGWSHLLQSGSLRPKDVPAALETIDRNARAQAQLVDDLLDMSRIVSGRIRVETKRIDLEPIARAAVESMQPAAQAKGLQMRMGAAVPGAFVLGDAARLQQVIWNLLSNSVKFTPIRGRIEVSLAVATPHVELTVTDNGAGIAPEFLPHVFERFRQQDASTTRRHGGLGLGLSIVKQLVELHGGTVRASSLGEGYGTSFVVTLPAAVDESELRLAGAAAESLPVAAPALHGIRVMVVDDEVDTRDLLQQILSAAGAAVQTAASAGEALSSLVAADVDVLISDISMPDLDGCELIQQVRHAHRASLSSLPAIAISAYARAEDRERALRAGYQVYLTKPLNADQLLAVVADATAGC